MVSAAWDQLFAEQRASFTSTGGTGEEFARALRRHLARRQRSWLGFAVVAICCVALLLLSAAVLAAVATMYCPWPTIPTLEEPAVGVYELRGDDLPAFTADCLLCSAAYQLVGLAGKDRVFDLLQRAYGKPWLEEECLLEAPELFQDLFRPPVDCAAFCTNVTEVPYLDSLTRDEFMDKYAFTGQTIVVRNGTQGWKAAEQFSFEFFKEMYEETVGIEGIQSSLSSCNFFGYKTNFTNLREVLEMPREDSLGLGRKWYIGWSNCQDPVVKEKLRSMYERPGFLPEDISNSHTDWMFMGTPGPGAAMHADAIFNPSWQAQVRGTKKWRLQPVPECASVCQGFEVTLSPGDIIVIDTHRWYHETEVLLGGLSITIGSEFSKPGDAALDDWDAYDDEDQAPR